MRAARYGGGWRAIAYSLRMARRAGGFWKFYRALRSRNACKTCALGMGGQRGGMVNEQGRFPEVCKKSMQAMAADMQGRIQPEFWAKYGFAELRACTPRELELMGRLSEPVYAGPGDTHYHPISWDAAIGMCVERLRGGEQARAHEGTEAPGVEGTKGRRDEGTEEKPSHVPTFPHSHAAGSDEVTSAPSVQARNLRGSRSPDETFFYFSGRASNEAAFLWQLFARLYGTNNVNNCSYYCHQASGVGLRSALGTGTATITLDDLERCDLLVLIGGNPASNHPRLMAELMRLRRRGGKVIVVNPLREVGLVNFRVPSDVRSLLFGSEIASLYVQPHIGGDTALLVGTAKALLDLPDSAIDASFLERHTHGFEALRGFLRATPWEAIVASSGVSREVIESLARVYAQSRATVFAWTMGITHHVHGVDNVRAIANLALLRGMVGRPGAGLLPIRGHSNVQGVGSVGVVPQLAEPVLRKLESHFGVKLPTRPGLDTLACIDAMHRGEIRNAFCLGGNLFGSNPDAARTAEAFERLEFCAYVSTTLNTGHAWGRAKHTLILPARARDEEPQPTTQESMFNYVRISDGGPPRVPGARSEVEIVADIASRVLGPCADLGPVDGGESGPAGPSSAGPIDWGVMRSHAEIRRAIAAVIPGFEALREVDTHRREFQIDGRTLLRPEFRTSDGKAHLHVTPLPKNSDPPGTLRLMTIRSEGQFNTVVYEDEDVYRGQERRDVILMNEEDMVARGLRRDQWVIVRSETGAMRALVRPIDIRAGNAAMYYPEANAIVPRRADPESKTPAFKNVAVTVEPEYAGRVSLPVAVR